MPSICKMESSKCAREIIAVKMVEEEVVKIKLHSIINEYTVYWNHRLGTGVSGPVRLCTRKSSGEKFALKCIPDNPKSHAEVKLHLLCSNHPNIVTVCDVYANDVQFPGEQKPRPRLLLVLELMDGGELFDRISQEKCFTEKKAANYLLQIALAIRRCHSLNIAHRDLKPENLLLKSNLEEVQIKLSDFGFAKVDDGNLQTPQYTPYYVAPQVLEAHRHISRQRQGATQMSKTYTYNKSCDMWSLGVILYIMLCGYPPFYSETPSRQITKAMKSKILCGNYDFPKDEWQSISEEAKDVIRRLIHVDPSFRFDVEELLSHPWLLNAPDTELKSPAIISNKDELHEVQMAHSQQLTSMRILDSQITLKPLTQINNPIIRKRQHKQNSMESVGDGDEPPHKQGIDEIKMKLMRDLIAYCILPPKVDDDENVLCDLVSRLLRRDNSGRFLQDIVTRWGWNGTKFTEKVEKNELAEHLSQILQNVTRKETVTDNGD